MNSVLKFAAGLIAFVLILGAVGQEDMKDSDEQQAFYCQQVKDHAWPDFKNNYNKVCEK